MRPEKINIQIQIATHRDAPRKNKHANSNCDALRCTPEKINIQIQIVTHCDAPPKK